MQAIIFLLLLVSCCSTDSREGVESALVPSLLVEKIAAYEHLAEDKFGGKFIEEGCDSLLFTGLYYATGADTKIEAARADSGQWYRRDLKLGNCYPEESKSEISRDMFIGLLWGIWNNQRDELLREIIRYGEKKNWRMGAGDPSRTVLSPQLVSTMYQMAGKMYGDKRGKSSIALVTGQKLKGFEAHLQALHIALRGEIHGEITASEYKDIEYMVNRQPNNALFAAILARYTKGDQTKAINILLNEKHWPSNKLPTTANHCEFWLWQRDETPKDWGKCKPVTEHSGADFLFVAKYIVRGVERVK